MKAIEGRPRRTSTRTGILAALSTMLLLALAMPAAAERAAADARATRTRCQHSKRFANELRAAFKSLRGDRSSPIHR